MSFAADIAKWADKVDATMDEAVRAVRHEAVVVVTDKMPVDTGQARGSLIASIGSPASSPEIDDKSGAGAIGRAQSAINAPADNIFYYTSNLPYIWTLEYGGFGRGPGKTSKTTSTGFSSQAPSGVFRVSAIKLRQNVQEKIRNA